MVIFFLYLSIVYAGYSQGLIQKLNNKNTIHLRYINQ